MTNRWTTQTVLVGQTLLLILSTTILVVDCFVVNLPIQYNFLDSRCQYCLQSQGAVCFSSTSQQDGDHASGTPVKLESLTVVQLKEKLRQQGLRVSGRKHELIARLLESAEPTLEDSESSTDIFDAEVIIPEMTTKDSGKKKSKASQVAEEHGKELIDVTPFLSDDEKGKAFKSWGPESEEEIQPDEDDSEQSGPEIWGEAARIVDDLDGRAPVIDSMSHTIVELVGSNQTTLEAYVVASRDALKSFLAGGKNETGSPADRLREIQVQREQAAKRHIKFEEDEGLDEGDETGLYTESLHRDFSDWGKYSVTGAKLSASEVQGVIILSDKYGAFSEGTKALADKIAFECQPIVVMVPDLYRGNPWKENSQNPSLNVAGQTEQEWRRQHSDVSMSVDTRVAAIVLREKYDVTSIAVWGMGHGGGRALEIAAGHLPGGRIHDVDGTVGPAPVDPDVAIAWYPIDYDAKKFFGTKDHRGLGEVYVKEDSVAVMGVFAGDDQFPGATSADAAVLKSLLEEDERIKDYIVKVFPEQEQGFAHLNIGGKHEEPEFVDGDFGATARALSDDSDADIACLLSTAFMETHARQFLPTTGIRISKDENAEEWNNELEMRNFRDNPRDVRKEIKDAAANFKSEPVGGIRVDPTDANQRDKLADILRTMELEDVSPEYKIQDDDDLETIYAKLTASDDNFQLL